MSRSLTGPSGPSKKGGKVMDRQVSIAPLDGKADTATVRARAGFDLDFEIGAFVWPGEGNRLGRFDLSLWVNHSNEAAIIDLEVLLAGTIDNCDEIYPDDWMRNLKNWKALLLRLLDDIHRGERSMLRYRKQAIGDKTLWIDGEGRTLSADAPGGSRNVPGSLRRE